MVRTKAKLKKHGITHGVVERWIQRARKRIDLFGIIDLIALDNGIVGIQVTGTDFSSHKIKIMEEKKENTLEWLSNTGRLECWGWRKLKKVKGKKATYWAPRIADVLIVNGELYWEERK
jgi:hypothetical protein